MALLLLAFLAGVLTVLAPCVLPLLPVIIGGSIGGDANQKSRPYLIVGSLAVSLALFSFLLKASTLLLNVSPFVWVYLSGGLIVALGLASLFPTAWDKLALHFNWQAKSQQLLGKGAQTKKPVLGSILTGAALGPVFSSCSPTYAFILATVLPRSFASGLAYLAAYILGLIVVMLAVALLGRKFIVRFEWAVNPLGWFRRGIGLLFIVVGLVIMLGIDKKIETWLIVHSPIDATRLEQRLFDKGTDSNTTRTSSQDNQLFNVSPTPAPDFTDISAWLNSKPLTLQQLRGKVVLIDFWTYSCINCVRTLPYVQKWYETYKDQGFVVVGVHAPEFAFEHSKANVRQAAKKHRLTYPIALDNNFATWNAYSNQYWPAHYLIDKEGNIRRTHFGEGEYQETEEAIQTLLGASKPLTATAEKLAGHQGITPETYFGTARAQTYKGSPALQNGTVTYTPADNLRVHHWTLKGAWQVDKDKITSKSNEATLISSVKAKDVYVVASRQEGAPRLAVTASSKGDWYGKDAPGGTVTISQDSIYHIASFARFQEVTLMLKVPAGVSLHTFTFGGN